MAQRKYDTVIVENATVKMVYRRADGDITERIVTIDRVWESSHGIAFVGFCHTRQERRTFNVSNVLWAMPDDCTPIRSFTAQERLERATAAMMALSGRTVLAYSGATDSASRLSGWD